MNIEFHTAYGKIPEKLVVGIRDRILSLSHLNKSISRAEVMLKEEESFISNENKVCEIRLTIYDDDLFAHARTGSFESSVKEVINELKRLVKQQVKRQKGPTAK